MIVIVVLVAVALALSVVPADAAAPQPPPANASIDYQLGGGYDTTAEVVTRCDRLLLVADASVAGVCSAGRMAAVLDPLHDRVGVVVRRRTSALPAAQVANALDLPLVAEVPHHRRLAEHVDLGLGPVHARRSALARAARSVLADPAERAAVA